MATKKKRTKEERAIYADVRCRIWLAKETDAKERGNHDYAAKCASKAQFWLDRWNLLENRGEKR